MSPVLRDETFKLGTTRRKSLELQVQTFIKRISIGKNIEKNVNFTGLDPAGPLFWPPVPERNLVKEDASFVDVIHTNMHQRGDDTYLGGDGHADFYRNKL